MTSFNRKLFTGTEYVMYHPDGLATPGKFIGRFKRGGRAHFISFLVKNFEVEEYFDALATFKAPLPALQSKGYLQAHVQKWMREAGLPVERASMPRLCEILYRENTSIWSKALDA